TTGELGIVDVPSHDHLTTESLEAVKDERQVESTMKQYVSDRYEKRVKLVGVRTTREATIKPSDREIHFANKRLVSHPVWTAILGAFARMPIMYEALLWNLSTRSFMWACGVCRTYREMFARD